MKRFLIIMLAFAAAVSCSKDNGTGNDGLAVIPHNLAGTWQLVELNGSAVPEGLGYYIEMNSSDKTYVSYSNMDGGSDDIFVKSEGKYDIWTGDVIWGYATSYEWWDYKWQITALTKDSMTWETVEPESGEVRRYSRISELPAIVTGGSASDSDAE